MPKNSRFFVPLFAVVLLVCGCSGANRPFLSQQAPPDPAGYRNSDLLLGAQLYDNWLKIKRVSRSSANPLYPRATANARNTHRCYKCHGWDYRGRQWKKPGAGKTRRVPGLTESTDRPADEIFLAIARGPEGHAFGEVLSEGEIWALTRFIREGIPATKKMVSSKGQFRGNPQSGRAGFAARCVICHGADGNGIDFSRRKPGVQGLSYLAKHKPEQTLHRTRWGMAGKSSPSAPFTRGMFKIMPAAAGSLGLSGAEIADILAYAATLPE